MGPLVTGFREPASNRARVIGGLLLAGMLVAGTSQAALEVSPASGLNSAGPTGGPFSPNSQVYTLSNTGFANLNWSADNSQPWVTLSSAGGTIGPFGQTTVTVSINAAANSLLVGSYADTVHFSNLSGGFGSTSRSVSLAVKQPASLNVKPADGLASSGPTGGPFSPSSTDYTLINAGDVPLAWAAAKTQPWVSLSATGGTLGGGASTTVTVSINSQANDLGVGSHGDTVTFTNTTNGNGNTSRNVTLTILQPATLDVTPADGLASSGLVGGPFSPSSRDYNLSNTGGLPLDWSAAKTQPWVSLSATGGTLGSEASTIITVSINAAANSLSAGEYSDTVTFTNTTNGNGNTIRSVTLTVAAPPGALCVTPATGLSSAGRAGGPFSPIDAAYQLRNDGGKPLDWTAGATQSWVTLSQTGGTLSPGASDSVTISIGPEAASLPIGSYSDTVTFTNATSGIGDTSRSVLLTVQGPLTFYVSTGGDDVHDGLSWSTAKRTVQAGLDTAIAGDQVWVAAGTYVQCVTLKSEVALYGGFAGGETMLWQRDWIANRTILDGNQTGSVVSVANARGGTRIDGFTIRNGEAGSGGGTANGGGIRCVSSHATIANNTISGNSASGALTHGGGIYCYSSSSVTIASNTIAGNSGDLGGGICCDSCTSSTIINNIITDNVSLHGGGIYSSGAGLGVIIANNAITGNNANYGGGIDCVSSYPSITGNTISGNMGIWFGGGICCEACSPMITETIIAFNVSGIRYIGSATPALRGNCVYGNTDGNYLGLTDPTGTNGNISADPRFVDASPGPDGIWATADDTYADLRLLPGSPCIDAGSNGDVPRDTADLDADGNTIEPLPIDLAGGSRFANDPFTPDTGSGTPPIVDIGAYEYHPGDADGDGHVDVVDLLITAGSFGVGSGDPDFDPRADFNHDTKVDVSDLLVLADNWGT